MKINMDIPQKNKNRPTLWSHHTMVHWAYIQKNVNQYAREIAEYPCITILFTTAKL
jgi:hypothetical protein